MCADENRSTDEIVDALKTSLEEQPIADVDFIACIWQGLMADLDLSINKTDQLESQLLKTVDKYAPVLEPFCKTAQTQVALINTVQIFCYGEQRVMKTFPQILKVLYNKDCVSAQAILYWHSKGSKLQGRAHFLQATDSLVKVRLLLYTKMLLQCTDPLCSIYNRRKTRRVTRKSKQRIPVHVAAQSVLY